MTFCKILAETQNGKKAVTAIEEYEKFSSVPRYSVVVSVDGIAVDVIRAAKTTWKKRFREETEA